MKDRIIRELQHRAKEIDELGYGKLSRDRISKTKKRIMPAGFPKDYFKEKKKKEES